MKDAEGQPLPMVVPVIMQPGRQAAANILPFRRDETASPTDYHNPGTPATIRRVQAVAQMGGLDFMVARHGWSGWARIFSNHRLSQPAACAGPLSLGFPFYQPRQPAD